MAQFLSGKENQQSSFWGLRRSGDFKLRGANYIFFRSKGLEDEDEFKISFFHWHQGNMAYPKYGYGKK